MTVFAVLMPSPQPNLAARIKALYASEHLPINDTQWLISTVGTVNELSAKLGIFDPAKPAEPPTGSAVIFATSAYFGRAPATIWDWLKIKLETPPSA